MTSELLEVMLGSSGLIKIALYLIISNSVIYYFANKMNNKFQLNNPNSKSFVWGYFMGISSIYGSILAIIFNWIGAAQTGLIDMSIWVIIIFYILAFAIFIGYWTIKRNRIALVIATIITMFPIIWIINFFYLKNRWNELS